MEQSDKEMIDSIFRIVEHAQRRKSAEPDDEGLGSPFYRLYWLALSDLGVAPGCIECECPTTGERWMVPGFVQRFASQPGVMHLRSDEDIFENFGYLSFVDIAHVREAYCQLVLAAQGELAQPDPVFRYVEIEARTCAAADLGGPPDEGIGQRLYGAQVTPGKLCDVEARPS